MANLGLVDAIVFGPVVADGAYKHMGKRDAAVWHRWLAIHAAHWQGVAYDVAVGGHLPSEEPAEGEFVKMWQYQTALKIDALIVREDRVMVVEVRPWATVSALGACLCYTIVLERAGLTKTPLYPAIVCEGIQTDVKWCADQLHVQVFEV